MSNVSKRTHGRRNCSDTVAAVISPETSSDGPSQREDSSDEDAVGDRHRGDLAVLLKNGAGGEQHGRDRQEGGDLTKTDEHVFFHPHEPRNEQEMPVVSCWTQDGSAYVLLRMMMAGLEARARS